MRQQRRDETESSRGGMRLGHDFMQRAAGKTALGQAGIQRGKAKAKSCA